MALPLCFVMFEKFMKKMSEKATDSAISGAKETLNDKLDTYSGIIKIGLTLAVIIFGSSKIVEKHQNHQKPVNGNGNMTGPVGQPGYFQNYPGYPNYPQQPIVINNYITDGRNNRGGNAHGQPRKDHSKH